MKPGTRTLLFGVHQVFIHPWVVAYGWWKLYGFPWDPRLWVAFIVHDWGYWGKPNLDGAEGELHPLLGANIMGFLFGRKWQMFCLTHSRFFSRQYGLEPSKLCYADKLAITLLPKWAFLTLAQLSGEVIEYRAARKYEAEQRGETLDEWYEHMTDFVSKYVAAHSKSAE